ncbi:MAG: hypothetical protein RSB39_09940, partial [Oscillospiraceae bacterium]
FVGAVVVDNYGLLLFCDHIDDLLSLSCAAALKLVYNARRLSDGWKGTEIIGYIPKTKHGG